VLRNLGSERVWVTHGADGLDEMSTTGPTKIVELKDGAIRAFEIAPEDVGLTRVDLAALKGGDAAHNAEALKAVLAGARNAYAEMIADPDYLAPQRWDAVDASTYDALLLPGGHRARGMREYLESDILQNLVVRFFEEEKPVAAICHGVLLEARSISKRTGRSVLHGYQTTALTWAFENSAWSVARITRFWDPNYYRTYLEQASQPKGFMSVQQEVTRALARPEDFRDVPRDDPLHRRKTSGLARDTMGDETPAFVVRDRHYVSARWPGDVHTFAKIFAGMLN
jgi:putative intracellular protease/amidase